MKWATVHLSKIRTEPDLEAALDEALATLRGLKAGEIMVRSTIEYRIAVIRRRLRAA